MTVPTTLAVVALGVFVGVLANWSLRVVLGKRADAKRSTTQSQRSLHEVFDSAGQMFVEIDEHGRVLEWNRTAERMSGWTAEEVHGRDPVDIVVPAARRPYVRGLLERLAATTYDWGTCVEAQMIRKGHDVLLDVELTMWTACVDGRWRLDILVQDITDRKRLEAEREHLVKQQKMLVDELREADKTKSDFVSTVSHELRTPLTSIVGYVEMLSDGFAGGLSAQQTSMLQVVDRNTKRLLSLIDDLLTLSRIEAGTFRVEAIDVEIAPFVAGVVQTIIPSSRESSLQLEVDVAANTSPVHGDPHQLERVLMNLLSNAIKFTPERGRVSVRAYSDDDHVYLSVQDTGIGIPVDEQSRLFTRFFRSGDAQARAIPGTGLGLTIVKSIVDRHGGEISLQSAPGKGTTVNVIFPAANRTAS